MKFAFQGCLGPLDIFSFLTAETVTIVGNQDKIDFSAIIHNCGSTLSSFFCLFL